MNRIQQALALTLVVVGSFVVACRQEAQPPGEDEAKSAQESARDAAHKIHEGLDEAGKVAAEGAEKLQRKVGPEVEKRLSDAEITARVKAKLLAEKDLHAFDIDVDTVNGVVTLNGRAHAAAERKRAEELARGTRGVERVIDLIQVEGETPPPGR